MKKYLLTILLFLLSGCSLNAPTENNLGAASIWYPDGTPTNAVLVDPTWGINLQGADITNIGTATSTTLCLTGDNCITSWPDNYWSRTGSILSPATSGDSLLISGTGTSDYGMFIYSDITAANEFADLAGLKIGDQDNKVNITLINGEVYNNIAGSLFQAPVIDAAFNDSTNANRVANVLITGDLVVNWNDGAQTYPALLVEGKQLITGNLNVEGVLDVPSITGLNSLSTKFLLLAGDSTESGSGGSLYYQKNQGGTLTLSGSFSRVGSAEFFAPTIAGTPTIATSSTVYINDAPNQGTSKYALWVDSGATRLDGVLTVGAYSLPIADGSVNQVLTTDGAGSVTWGDAGGGGYTNLTQFIAQTPWRMFYSDASGTVAELALGDSGKFLYSSGTTSPPTWEIASSSVVWGGITGTLSDQVDLQGALDAKVDESGSLADITNHSHTVLTDIGTKTHAQIDTFMGYHVYDIVNFNYGYGKTALDSLTTGKWNVAAGENSLTAATAAFGNIAIGFEAQKANSTCSYNIGIGRQALTKMTTGTGNVGVGDASLSQLVSGNYNTAIGYGAASKTTSSNINAFGYNALRDCTSGGSNAAFGDSALFQLTTGAGNTAIGQVALGSCNNHYNTGIGFSAGRYNVTGQYNVYIGANAGDNLTAGSSNIFIGYGVDGSTTTISNELNIGNTLYGTINTGDVWTKRHFTIGTGAAGIDYSLTFDGETNDGVLTWMEDEDLLNVADTIKFSGGTQSSDGSVGTTTDVIIKGSDGNDCTLNFKNGLLTNENCP